MNEPTDGRHSAILPTGRFVARALVLPLLLAPTGGYALYGDAGWWWPWLVVGAVIALVATWLLRDRHMRTMPVRWRVFWVLLGLGIGVALSIPTFFVAILAAIYSCDFTDQCFIN